MDSFHAKISQQWPKKRENKKNRYDEFLPVPEQRISKKMVKKFKKLKKSHYGFFFSQNMLEKAEKV